VEARVLRLGWQYLEVFRMVVPFITVDVVNNFAGPQWPADFCFSEYTMDVAPVELHVAVGRTYPP
jgi:hypothetical protein